MAGLKVYFDLMSQPCRAVMLFLKVNNISFSEKPIDLRHGECCLNHDIMRYTDLL